MPDIEAAKADLTKRTMTALKKLHDLKVRVQQSSQRALDISQLIATDPKWKWASSPDVNGKMRACLQKLDEHKVSSEFWTQWTARIHI